jgi:hypothetical protein
MKMGKPILKNLRWIEEQLPPEIHGLPKHGGMAYYLDGKLVLILVEKDKPTYEHKGVEYPFDLWNGVILPIEYRKQGAFFLKFSFLENHPGNRDWLYIPVESENFEDEVQLYLGEILKRNILLGLPVKFTSISRVDPENVEREKKPKTAKKTKADKKKENAHFLSMTAQRRK